MIGYYMQQAQFSIPIAIILPLLLGFDISDIDDIPSNWIFEYYLGTEPLHGQRIQLKSIFNNYNYHIITEKTKATKSLVNEFPGKINYLVYGTKDYPFRYFFKFIYNFLHSFKYCLILSFEFF